MQGEKVIKCLMFCDVIIIERDVRFKVFYHSLLLDETKESLIPETLNDCLMLYCGVMWFCLMNERE